MKKIMLSLFILLAFHSVQALTIQQVIAKPQGNDVNIRLTVSDAHYFEYVGYSYTIENGVITMIVCYNPVLLSVITTNEQYLTIDGINSEPNNFTIAIETHYIRYENGAPVCDFQSTSDTFTGYFATPLSAPQVLSSKRYLYESNQITVFPNPTHDYVYYQSANEIIDSVSVFDHLGRLVEGVIDPIGYTINLANLSSGVYYAHFNIRDKVAVKKIVLSR